MKPAISVLMSCGSSAGAEIVEALCTNGHPPNLVVQLKINLLKKIGWFWKTYDKKVLIFLLREAASRKACSLLLIFRKMILGRGRDDLRRDKIKCLTVKSLYSPQVINSLQEISPDFILTSGVGIIRKSIILSAKAGVLNIHPGILPEFRGNDPVYWTLKNGGDFGFTVHFMDESIDTGPIIVKRIVKPQGESIEDFKLYLFREGLEAAIGIIKNYSVSGNVQSFPQKAGNYYKSMPFKERVEIAKKFRQIVKMTRQ